MSPTPPKSFSDRLAVVYGFYNKEFTRAHLEVWWAAMQGYDERAIADALNRHCTDPDRGQFLPRPADLIRLIGGGTQDAALLAWSKVDSGIREAGAYASVVFDDPLIHAVLTDMGGWQSMCSVMLDELPFKAKEFENRYRGYRNKGAINSWPTHLPGIAEGHNKSKGLDTDPPLMIGDRDACERTYQGGAPRERLGFQPLRLSDLGGAAA